MQALPSVESLISQFAAHGIALPQGPIRVDGYGDSADLSKELLGLIKSGRKQAGTGLLWAYEHDREPIAASGDIEIVVDHRNQPALITRIVSSEIVAFNEVSAEYAAVEGEGDGSLAYWRKGHWSFFSRECRRIGREPTETMPVICSVFELLHVLPVPIGGLHPQVGVGVLVVRDGLLLLGKRKSSHGAGAWAAPGGRLEFGEALEDCARRELMEETGLSASLIELGPYSNDVFPEAERHFLTVFVVARGIAGAPQNLEPDKCEGWAWFQWDALPSPLFTPLQTLLAIGWRPGGA